LVYDSCKRFLFSQNFEDEQLNYVGQVVAGSDWMEATINTCTFSSLLRNHTNKSNPFIVTQLFTFTFTFTFASPFLSPFVEEKLSARLHGASGRGSKSTWIEVVDLSGRI